MATLNLEEHKKQIEAYSRERPDYVIYANVLERVLEAACKTAFPEVMVKARAKTIASFAEKAARKFEKYPDAVHQMTDLCGGRVTIQTLQQVLAVRQFIEANFTIIEKDDKTLLLKEDEFGYRDMHYVVQLKPDRDLGITSEERAAIGERKAEIQVRTWVQHAWADTLHDRMYKTKLRLSPETKRLGNLLAAIMEDGDRTFDHLANEVDGMLSNYSSYARREDVDNEVAVMTAVLENLPNDASSDERPNLTLRLAKLLIGSAGDYQRALEILEPFASIQGALRREILIELGAALCKKDRAKCDSDTYRRGQSLLQEAVDLGGQKDSVIAVDARKSRSLQGRGLARLGWSWENVEDGEHHALDCYRRALECEPNNPYYLADILGFEIYITRSSELTATTRITVKQAIQTCREHALAGIEMPYASFTAGRLSLLLGDGTGALEWYAHGLCCCCSATACVPRDVLENELAYVRRIHVGKAPPPEHERVKGLLLLARSFHAPSPASADQAKYMASTHATKLNPPVLVVAGGAASLPSVQIPIVQSNLTSSLQAFAGTVISGGTTSGVPGCVGAAALDLAGRDLKKFLLVGYIPRNLPHDASKDPRYDLIVVGDEPGFSTEQILRGWADLQTIGVRPSEVQILGFGGGPLSALEYRIALALGATVGVIMKSGGAADALIADPLWAGNPKLLPLPVDTETIRAFVRPSEHNFPEEVLEEMAIEFHRRYTADNTKLLPENLRPWEKLSETYQTANREQARYAICILEAVGFGVRPATGSQPTIFTDFTKDELERMAELEHGRWNVERLRSGWRYGQQRDNAAKIHNLIVPWSDKVLDDFRRFDYDGVRAFPEILAKAGLEVYRPRQSE